METLRFHSPAQNLSNYLILEDFEINGVKFLKGDDVLIYT